MTSQHTLFVCQPTGPDPVSGSEFAFVFRLLSFHVQEPLQNHDRTLTGPQAER